MVYRTMLKVTERFLGKGISIEYLGFIPHDEAIPRAVLKQQPVLSLFPKARVSRYFSSLAKRLWDLSLPDETGSNVKFFWRHLANYQV